MAAAARDPVIAAALAERARLDAAFAAEVLSAAEVEAVLAALHGVNLAEVMLLYGAGLRLSECLSLRVKDVDLERSEITVREGKMTCPRPSR